MIYIYIIISMIIFVDAMVLTSGILTVIFDFNIPLIGILISLAYVVVFWIVIDKLYGKKLLITFAAFIIVPIILSIILLNIRGPKHIAAKPNDEDIWNKDPNTWTENEKEYVDDFFQWQHENDQWK